MRLRNGRTVPPSQFRVVSLTDGDGSGCDGTEAVVAAQCVAASALSQLPQRTVALRRQPKVCTCVVCFWYVYFLLLCHFSSCLDPSLWIVASMLCCAVVCVVHVPGVGVGLVSLRQSRV